MSKYSICSALGGTLTGGAAGVLDSARGSANNRVVVTRVSPNDGSKADYRVEPAASSHVLGHNAELEGAGHPGRNNVLSRGTRQA